MNEVTLATICMNSTPNKEENIAKAFSLLEKAVAAGADWILLPETWVFFGPYSDLYDNAESDNSPLIQKLGAFARQHKIVLFAGSMGEKPEVESRNANGDRRVYNTTYVFGRDGKTLCKYRKTHLFNLISESGKPLYCESDGNIPGNEVKTLDVDGFRVALSICYDLRFTEFYLTMAKERPLDVILVPSAFTLQTGMDHWEVLLRARAIEHQSYVFSSNQTGNHYADKHSYGHSMIVDPWGYKLADTGSAPGVAISTMSRERLTQVRAKVPALANKRTELYRL
jgi:deaminated glutathione amidase